MRTIYTDRSRIETFQHCARERFLRYHAEGRGLEPVRKPLPLCVGGAVHRGREILLRACMDKNLVTDVLHGNAAARLAQLEEEAVAAALTDFSRYKSRLALDLTEQQAMADTLAAGTAYDSFNAQMEAQARELGIDSSDPQFQELFQRQQNAAAEFDAWLFNEQSALVEGIVRAWRRRKLVPLITEFKVLEVEREGEWELARVAKYENNDMFEGSIRFMSRPDSLLLSRIDSNLYIDSCKTAATWDIRKARDAEHDMQGLSEGVEVERRLGEWWRLLNDAPDDVALTERCKQLDIAYQTGRYLKSLSAPPRIMGIRYEYLLKGIRYEDRDLSARFGIKVWSQRSHLIRNTVAHSTPQRGKNVGGYQIGDRCWSWDYHLEDGTASKLSGVNWKAHSVWEDGTVKEWIDALDDTQEAMSAEDSTVGMEPRSLGWKSRGQAMGYTATHPLDDVFPAPLLVYRSDDQLRDWIDQVEAQEVRVAEAVAQVDAAADDGERRHLLNVHFGMTRRACSYPSECPFTKVCYGGDDIRSKPLESGLYRRREPHHTPESEALAAKEDH